MGSNLTINLCKVTTELNADDGVSYPSFTVKVYPTELGLWLFEEQMNDEQSYMFLDLSENWTMQYQAYAEINKNTERLCDLIYSPSSFDLNRMKGLDKLDVFRKMHFAAHKMITEELEEIMLSS